MIYQGIEYFNVAEIEKEESGAIVLRRFPKSLIDSLNAPVFNADGVIEDVWYGGRETASFCEGVEIRLVTSAPSVEVALESDRDADVMVFWGDYFLKRLRLRKDEILRDTIENLECMLKMRPEVKTGRFPTNLLRVCFSYSGVIRVHDVKVNGGFSLPDPSVMPKRAFVLGTSISHGQNSEIYGCEYVQVLGRELGLDMVNKAIAGGCFCERETLDFVLAQEFDLGIFEIGTNIASRPEFFVEERLGTMIDEICSKFDNDKLVFITPLNALEDFSDMYYGWKNDLNRVREIMVKHLAKFPKVTVVHGTQLCSRSDYFSADVLHPSPYGYFKIAEKLASIIKPLL